MFNVKKVSNHILLISGQCYWEISGVFFTRVHVAGGEPMGISFSRGNSIQTEQNSRLREHCETVGIGHS